MYIRGGGIQSCADGYFGPLCQQCLGWDANRENYYADVAGTSCQKCGTVLKESLVLVAVIIGIGIYYSI